MSSPMKSDLPSARPELPSELLRSEQRLAERALRLWHAGGRQALASFAAQGLLIADPAGSSEIVQVADRISRTFGLALGQRLALDPALPAHGLGMELRAACDLVALGGEAVRFGASLSGQAHGLILARGVALPLGADAGRDLVQVVMSWREVLNRSAAARLKRELGLALQDQPARQHADALPLGRL